MLSSIFVSYLPYALVTSFTPGPNNVLALHTVSQNGWARGKNTLLGIIAGFFCVMAVCALFCYQLNHFLPTLSQALRYVGAGYILWLAVHVARSKPAGEESRKASFWKGFLLQFVNVKIIFYAITIYTGYVFPAGGSGTMVVQPLLLTLVGTAGFMTWAAAGGLFQAFLTTGPSTTPWGRCWPSVPWAWWSEGPGEPHRDFPKISPKPDGRGLPGLLQWGWKHHPL